MYILPAIDLRGGKCVRLIQGEYNRQITYKDDPTVQAQEFIDDGSEWLHIVDLDGAKLGRMVNLDAISAIAALGKLKIEVGGGIRDEKSLAALFDKGITRAIIGTRALTDFDWFVEMAKKFEHKIVLSLDARGSKVAAQGWLEDRPETLIEFARKVDELPLAAIIYTDIDRDGMMSGPNLERAKSLVEAVNLPIVAAGGVNAVEDIQKLTEIGVDGAIIGRALYEGSISLADALNAV